MDAKTQAALDELRKAISARYPSATFEIGADPDESASVLLWTTVDVDDPDEVLDHVMERLLELQVDERVPVHVVPIRTPERVAAYLKANPPVGRRQTVRLETGRIHPTGV